MTHTTEIGMSVLKQIILVTLLPLGFFPIISTLSSGIISAYKKKTSTLWHFQLFATEFPTNLSIQLEM